MAQAAKQIRKSKDLAEAAAQEQREKEEEKLKRRNRSRDRRRKVRPSRSPLRRRVPRARPHTCNQQLCVRVCVRGSMSRGTVVPNTQMGLESRDETSFRPPLSRGSSIWGDGGPQTDT